MRRNLTRLFAVLAIAPGAMFAVLSTSHHASAAAPEDTRRARPPWEVAASRQVEIARIASVLERTTANPAARRKAVDKLATLDDRRIRLIASLCERVAADRDGPAVGLALVLITALLILS